MRKGIVLVVAGSDSSGGAGLKADQKVIAAHECYAMTATTALTAQNTQGVEAIHLTPPDFVRKQIDICISDIGCDVVKTGMLASAETINVVAEALRRHNMTMLVVDPNCFPNIGNSDPDLTAQIQFARANALATYKAKTMENIAASARIITHIHNEMALHIDYCKGFGVSKQEMDAAEESEICTVHARYVLDTGHSEDWLALQVSMAPRLIGYSVIANRLHAHPSTKRKGNIYWTWIENYVTEDYTEVVKLGTVLLERNMVLQSPHRLEELELKSLDRR